MKVLWVIAFVLPEASKFIGEKKTPFGGWIGEMIEKLKSDSSIDLAIAMKSSVKELKKIEDKNITYYFLPTKKKDSSDVDIDTCNFILRDFCPDILHAEGTEHKFTKTFLENWNGQNVVSLQGVLNGYKNYEFGGLKLHRLLFRPTHIKDIIFAFLMIINKALIFNKRVIIEKQTIGLAKNILGRTIWDRSHYYYFNKDASYFRCNRILRSSFYSNYKKNRKYEPYSIFLGNSSQARKGAHFVLEAVALLKDEFPNLKLYVAGLKYSNSISDIKSYFGYRSYLNRKIKELKLAKYINFVGILNEKEMAQTLIKMHVYVMSSVIENSPNTLGEAMMLGVPCVASYNGGVSEMANDEKESLLYRSDDPKMLAYQIKRIFESRDLAILLSENAYKKASLTHNSSKNYRDLINCYQTIIEK
ncbi:glycosyltransferase family 4 protein [Mesonia sp. K4-1]|uniref:glycosyltransferase family 4 protein n=1 Tax=Mesonia sp. K4-1 TaxID=2602760 RepID=UPI0011CBD1D8|nr:glycosyltransferase family 4 protein [Mesonia sp. K4-1]TXK77878.1 glycosyltransferase family 4 protein [Mesonia sp. K4-1]